MRLRKITQGNAPDILEGIIALKEDITLLRSSNHGKFPFDYDFDASNSFELKAGDEVNYQRIETYNGYAHIISVVHDGIHYSLTKTTNKINTLN